jgi:antitoxin component YwqK of YwqJK toxin-antitoxin module
LHLLLESKKYYFPSGKIWIEQELKNGKPWTVIANYTENGQKRDAGTLKEGNGMVIFYNDDGTIRETVVYKNGVASGQ